MTDSTRKFFDNYSSGFNAIYGKRRNVLMRYIDRYFRRSMVLRYHKTMASCQPIQGKTVLDIGCGPGYYAITLAKAGAARVVGIDFAPGMIEIARKSALEAGVDEVCDFRVADFFTLNRDEKFDFVIGMGIMDYIDKPLEFIKIARQQTRYKLLLSFPASGGFLAWQRKLRYKFKCPLFLYSETDINRLLHVLPGWQHSVEKIRRDYFVTIKKNPE